MKKLISITVFGAMMALTGCSTLTISGDANQNFGSYELGRSLPERIIDESIEFTARKNLLHINGVSESTVRIALDSFRREVLVTGEVPSQAVKADIEAMLKSMRDVAVVYNYLTVTDTPKSQSHTVHESYLKSKINARLITNHGIKASQYKIIVRDRTAYIMGYMTAMQQDYILQAVQQTAGMASAVTLTTLVGNDNVPNTGMISPSTADVGMTNANTSASAVTVNAVKNAPNGATHGGNKQTTSYALQEIYIPNASTNAPTNSAPVYAPKGKATSDYVQLYQGTSTP